MTPRYPWPAYAQPLRCRMSELHVDGTPVPPESVDTATQRIQLQELGPWTEFSATVHVSTDEADPPGLADPTGSLIVDCVATHTRMPQALHGSPATGTVRVSRAVVEEAFLVRADLSAQIADRRRVVGTAPPWTVILDRRRAPTPPGAPPLPTAWIDFTSPDAPPAATANPDATALVDMSPRPRLLLNSGIEGLQSLLHSERPKLERRRLRDITATRIARYTAATLFRAAAAEVTALDDGTVQGPTDALLRQTCEAVAHQMSGVGSIEELYEQLVETGDPQIAAAELWARIDTALDTLTGSTAALAAAVRETRHG